MVSMHLNLHKSLVKQSITGTARDAIAYPATASVHCSPTSKHDPLSPLLLQPTRWSVGQEHGRFRLFTEAGGQGLTWGNIARQYCAEHQKLEFKENPLSRY
jgi:hypothetical protein